MLPASQAASKACVMADREKRPTKLRADKGYDYTCCRQALRKRGITPRIARRGIDSSQKLGCYW